MASTITVSTLNGLYSALAKATGGETILLAPGDYGKLSLGSRSGFDITFPSNVTIASADPNKPAVFSQMDLSGAANLTLDGLTFDYTFKPGDAIYTRPFAVNASDNITIRNSTFDGDVASGVSAVDNGYGFAVGLSVRGSTGIKVEDNEIFNFHRGMTVSESGNLTIVGNDIHSIRSDGMDFAEVKNVLIAENTIHDFRGSLASTDHRDMIQFWTNGTDSPSENIIIRGNTLDIGTGTATQSIFMRNDLVDRGLAGTEMFYRNVLIEENVIVNAHAHGITVGETAGLVIRNNSVLHNDGRNADGADQAVEIPQITVSRDATGVIIANNATGGLNGWSGQAGWQVRDNAFVQDQNYQAPGYYGNIFISTSLQTTGGIHDFRAVEGGMLDRLGAGATQTRDSSDAAVNAQFHVTSVANQADTRIFDASMSADNISALPTGTVFQWNFGDGTFAKGTVVSHSYTQGGTYNVTLTILQPGGITDTVKLPVPVAGSHILSMTADKGFVAYEAGAEIVLALPKAMTAEGLQLGATGVQATVNRAHVVDILGAEDFGISLKLDADVANTSGELFRLHGSFVASVDSKGELSFRAFTTEGEVKVLTKGAHLSDTLNHSINIRLVDGQLQVLIDGKLAGAAAMEGTLLSSNGQNLVFGNPWGGRNFNGDLKAFDIVKDASDFHKIAETTIIQNPFQSLDPVSAKTSFHTLIVDSRVSDLDTLTATFVKNRDTFERPREDQADDAAQNHRVDAPLGDRFEFLTQHQSDHILS